MQRKVNGIKDDQNARAQWGRAYDRIPKSVFALMAWHLANACAAECDTDQETIARAIEEIEALVSNDLMGASQGKRAIAAIRSMEVPE